MDLEIILETLSVKWENSLWIGPQVNLRADYHSQPTYVISGGRRKPQNRAQTVNRAQDQIRDPGAVTWQYIYTIMVSVPGLAQVMLITTSMHNKSCMLALQACLKELKRFWQLF